VSGEDDIARDARNIEAGAVAPPSVVDHEARQVAYVASRRARLLYLLSLVERDRGGAG
jgi:hypothetical protein